MLGIFFYLDLMIFIQGMYVWLKCYDILNGKEILKDVYFCV